MSDTQDMSNTTHASYASLHRAAVREALRAELSQALYQIETATHAVIGRWNDGEGRKPIYCYGTAQECEAFADGLGRSVVVVRMCATLKERASAHKVQAYRGIR